MTAKPFHSTPSRASGVTRPDISVLMIAYNVEAFVAEALESVLNQRVSYSYEIVVGEDCSTDGTRNILIDYAERHPDRIRLLLREKNLGMNGNFFATLQECTGRYVALIDADDYWTCPDKLQKQVAFLEQHPQFSTCFHNALVVYDGGTQPSHPFHSPRPARHLSKPVPKEISTVEDIVGGNFMQTASVVFRSGQLAAIPDWFYRMPTFDWPVHVVNAASGPIKYLDEVMSAYRVHAGGMWSTNFSEFRRIEDVDHMLLAYQLVDQHFQGRYHSLIRPRTRWVYEAAARLLYGRGEVQAGNNYLRRYFGELPVSHRLRERKLLLKMLCANYPAVEVLAKPLRKLSSALSKARES